MSVRVKKSLILLAVLLLLFAVSLYLYIKNKPNALPAPEEQVSVLGERAVLGNSIEGREIESYTYGSGNKHLLFVGGMHGGYEWNSVLLAYKVMDYLKDNPGFVPEDVTVTIIPNINPDGVYKVVGKEGRFQESDATTDKAILAQARFNANKVDLNRNFDCKWQPTGTWQNKEVSAGTSAFSEPEARALRDFVVSYKPMAVVFWHSQANAVYASECRSGVLPVTLDIMKAYADAGGYPSVKEFLAYPVTGDAEGWLASIGVPAITVELKTHESIEWDKNLAGIKALINYFK